MNGIPGLCYYLMGGESMANKEQGSSKNVKKVAKLSIKEKRALKREKRAQKGLIVPPGSGVFSA